VPGNEALDDGSGARGAHATSASEISAIIRSHVLRMPFILVLAGCRAWKAATR